MIRYAALLLVFALAACQTGRGQRPEDVPTLASVEGLATAQPLTQNAPPPPFDRALTTFALIDSGLTDLAGWRYLVQLEFNGVYAGSTRQANASARAEVSFNQVASARRVTFDTAGALFGQVAGVGDGRVQPDLLTPNAPAPGTPAAPLLGGVSGIGETATPARDANAAAYEAVRLGPDAFLVRDAACLSSRESAQTAADLRAGDLIGGVTTASPAGRRATINGEAVYAYQFAPDALNTPQIRLAEGGQIQIISSELWIAPARGVVIRFYANLTLTNAALLGRPEPVSGDLALRYDLYDVGTAFNITVPFGC